MFSIQIKLLIIAIFLSSLGIFILQNTQVVPLVLFGSTIANLPVGIVVLGAIGSGILTSLILQLLNQSKTQFPPEQRNTPNYSPSPRPREREKAFNIKENININNYQKKNVKDSAPTQISDNINKPISDSEVIENKQDSVKKDTVYSYSYPRDRQKVINQKDEVYDANYRVIMPPYDKNQNQTSEANEDNNDDEDWV